MKYKTYNDLGQSVGQLNQQPDRPVVCVQGLGFVGAAMAVAVASARDLSGSPCFNVIGVDLSSGEGMKKIDAINAGQLPLNSVDTELKSASQRAHSTGNLIATSDPQAYALASTIVVDVHLDVTYDDDEPVLALDNFRSAIRVLGEFMTPGCLIVIETTVPPGACDKIVAPELAKALRGRGLPETSFLLAHSYERVMPGKEYFNSIVNFWRVYAGKTPEAAHACAAFLSKVINVEDYPLTRLSCTTASETAKVLENSYRATTIAFIEEWGRFAEAVDVDLFEVIAAIRQRPTHSNMRQPGFGVGGYCLTKDPLLAPLASRELFGLKDLKFPFSELALSTNRDMPLSSLRKIQRMLDGNIRDKSLLLLGVSYRPDVCDTRYSPSQTFVDHAHALGAKVIPFDPVVDYWPEMRQKLPAELPTAKAMDGVIFAVPHERYETLNIETWLNGSTPAILDANNVLSKEQLVAFEAAGCKVASVGRGDSAL